MGESAGKYRKLYVDFQSGEPETCLIHGPGDSSGEYKVLVYFSSKYSKCKPNKGRVNHPIPKKKFNRHQGKMSFLIMWWMKSYYMKNKKY